MTKNYFESPWVKTVTVPVMRVGPHWEFYYGGDVPVADGTRAELRIEVKSLTDKRFLQHVSAERTVKVLEEGAALLVALSDPKRESPFTDWLPAQSFAGGIPPGTTRFVYVGIGPLVDFAPGDDEPQRQLLPDTGGVWFKFKGVEKCGLISSAIVVPINGREQYARSLNHAFTLLSQHYETERISHTGNAYRRVFYYEPRDGLWFPLDSLREAVQAQFEDDLSGELWQDVQRKLQVRGKRAGTQAGEPA